MEKEEIKLQIEQEKSDAASAGGEKGNDAVPAALDPKHTVFVVSSPLEVTVNDEPCTLSAGDIVQRLETEQDSNKTVGAKVLSAKGNDCSSGSVVRIQVEDLQDMHNDFRQKMDTGLEQLAKGGNGLPKAPDSGKKANPDGQAQPDEGADGDLNAQQTDAEGAEKEVQSAQSEPDNPNS